jgi:large subunit ribosomal protein L25
MVIISMPHRLPGPQRSLTCSAWFDRSSLVYINLDGKENAALVREKQRDYLRNSLKHVDFQVVSLSEKIRAKVAITLEGVSLLSKISMASSSQKWILWKWKPCLKTYLRKLPDLSKLKKIGDHFTVKDIALSDKVHVHASPDDVVVIVTLTKDEEAAIESATAAEPEVIEKGKKEEETE